MGQYLQDNTKDGIDLGFLQVSVSSSRFNENRLYLPAKTGASNREILYKILRTKYNKNDIAIIQWTKPK